MVVSPLPQRKHTRLSVELYRSPGTVCSVTIGVHDRRPIFSSTTIAHSTIDVLVAHREKTGVALHAYCLMPDHVHLLLSPSLVCDVITFVGQFKNLAQRAAWRFGIQGSFWQKGFYDHFIRTDEQLTAAIRYILENPIRAGLVHDINDYPFSSYVARAGGGGRAPALRAV